MKLVRLNNPHGLTLPVEACDTRWGLLYGGAAQLYMNMFFIAALFPIAFAEGTKENKIQAMKAVYTDVGFVDRIYIYIRQPSVR